MVVYFYLKCTIALCHYIKTLMENHETSIHKEDFLSYLSTAIKRSRQRLLLNNNQCRLLFEAVILLIYQQTKCDAICC